MMLLIILFIFLLLFLLQKYENKRSPAKESSHGASLLPQSDNPYSLTSSSSSCQVKHQVFLSFRGEDTRLNFTSHLLKALKDTGLNVFFDEEKLEKGEQLSPALSQGIAASNLSILVLSKDYASSKSCLAELSAIMDRKHTQGHIVLPIFYHVDPSHVRNIGGSFTTSFEEHESKRLVDEVKGWKAVFAEVGKLKGWHIGGGKFDRPETEYIEDIVKYVIKKLMSSKSGHVYEELVGIDYQKDAILRLIEQERYRVIGLWGMGGIGKTTLADVVHKEMSPKFKSHCFLQNVSEKIKNQGKESLRNDLLSILLNEKDIHIDTPLIGYPYRERLNNKKVLLVLDDVSHQDQITIMGVRHFGDGSKIIVTSRDRKVLENGEADQIYEVKNLNEIDSLQLFSTCAFKQLNPNADFRDLSIKFVEYTQYNPLALKVLGSQLYKRSREYWESEMVKLKEYSQPEISNILKRSFDGLDEQEKNIFLDIAIFFKGELKENVENILSSCYNGAKSSIRNLVDKCLLDITSLPISLRDMLEIRSRFLMKKAEEIASFPYRDALDNRRSSFLDKNPQCISMHDMLERMGKDIVRQESRVPGMRSRLWNSNEVKQVLRHNKGTEWIEGIKLDMSQIDKLQLCSSIFKNMFNLKYIHFYFPPFIGKQRNKKLHADQVGDVSLPDELRLLCWEYYPFRSLSSSFDPKNLVVLKLPYGDMEQLWNEDNHQDLINLRKIVLSNCKNLRKIPNLLGAVNLEILCFNGCNSLVELPGFSDLASLKTLQLHGCYKLKNFPELPNDVSFLDLAETGIEEVPNSIEHLAGLETLLLAKSKINNVSCNISKLECLRYLDFSHCLVAEFPEILRRPERPEMQELILPYSLPPYFPLPGRRKFPIVHVPPKILKFKRLEYLKMDHCESLKLLSELPPYLLYLDAHGCKSLEKVSFTDRNRDLYELYSFYGEDEFFMIFSDCFSLNQASIKNIEGNAMQKIESLVKKWGCKYDYGPKSLFCCFPGSEISASKFEYQGMNSSLKLKITPNEFSGSRVLSFAICLVVDLTHCHKYNTDLRGICEYQLTAFDGCYEKFECEWGYKLDFELHRKYMGDHVLILFSDKLIKKDDDYVEASFEFYIKKCYYKSDAEVDDIKVKKCGVHVYYVAENYKGPINPYTMQM
ncbi:disease resistance-like protein DSC1 [Gossypium hirsutum]|uniref:ADP-ribosyl cyclase/cyclic ADP-ribose hydrolase n=1 Tax=Gossypium hirsutum TaxID=3635 RepID=A0A1U8KEZ5_GOSHI|nr:disease resistance-like protein DSC1 [Gossypium hirsutum]XP_016701052.1 disease resistance-like protein DSC1 [Gossypium hirsutum]XP_040934180.1 disease resistance-like protein DSC1 [Gossypium hirsutum]